MKKLIFVAIAALAYTTAGLAQADPVKSTSAIKPAHTVNDGAAEAGHNSFTQQQAREHIAKSGYAKVSALAKGGDGVWRGTAHQHGHTVKVALDFKGNVTASRH